MSDTWTSLYAPTSDAAALIEQLRSVLAGVSFTPYDPFPGGTGTPPGFTHVVKLFVAPSQDGWVRVLGELDDVRLAGLCADLSTALDFPLVCAWLTVESGGFALYRGGQRYDDPGAFEPYRHPDHSPDHLREALEGKRLAGPLDTSASTLPPELQQLAQDQGVDARKAGKLVDRLGGNLFGRLAGEASGGGSDQQQARAIFAGGGRDIWNSLAGQRVRAIAETLALPANWRLPDLDTVRDAYQVHRMRQRYPRMAAMAGDREALAAVPGVADYVPVYMGKA